MEVHCGLYCLPTEHHGKPVTDKFTHRLGMTPYDECRKHQVGLVGEFVCKRKNGERVFVGPENYFIGTDLNTFSFPNGIQAVVSSQHDNDRAFTIKVSCDDPEEWMLDESSVTFNEESETMDEDGILNYLDILAGLKSTK